MKTSTTDADTPDRRLLVIDDEANMRHMLKSLLTRSGYSVETAPGGEAAIDILSMNHYDFVLCDLKMPGMGGMAFLQAAASELASTTVIVMSAYGSVDTALEAMKQGAYDYISKPFKTDEVLLALKKAEERESLRQENFKLKQRIRSIEEAYRFDRLVGKSPAMRKVFELAEKASRYNTTILIRGESGTGKELVARAIHFHGPRASGPLVPVNCGGIPESLLESELFGYRKGAFTGADRDKKGLFQEAQGGTIFLDEIGEMPLALQVKLLRVLQENEVRPVGAARTHSIDVRVIAATSKNLEEEIRTGGFRDDLYYRLNVLAIEISPLRTRTEDIPLLIPHFIDRFNRRFDRQVERVSAAAISRLLAYGWPGNVRELENAIERAVVLSEGTVLEPEHFALPSGSSQPSPAGPAFDTLSIKAARRSMEHTLITRALQETGGNRTQAARLLEISHPSLLTKIRNYNIDL